jgi:hypothetical protein
LLFLFVLCLIVAVASYSMVRKAFQKQFVPSGLGFFPLASAPVVTALWREISPDTI